MVWTREMKRAQKALWIWTIAIGGMSFLILSVYPQFAANQNQLAELMQLYPDSIKKAFNIEQLGFGNALSFYAVEGYLFVTLFGSVYAALLGGGMLVKEESDRTIEFLLAKPISRTSIFLQKLGAVFTIILIFNLALTVINFIAFQIASDEALNMKLFVLISLAPLLLHLTFATISYGLATFFKKQRMVTAISLAIVLFMYFLSIAASISTDFSFMKWVTPFEYVNAGNILKDGNLHSVYLLIMFGCIVGFLVMGLSRYRSKDLIG